MSQLYNCSEKCYNISSAETNRLSGLFFLPNHLNTIILVNLAAASRSPGLFVSAPTDKAKRGCGFYFVQLNRKAQALLSPELLEDHGMNVKKTAYPMIAPLPVAVKSYPKFFPTIPNEESPGNYSASDSLSFLTRHDEPGLSPLFPLLAASIVVSLMSGAASPISKRS